MGRAWLSGPACEVATAQQGHTKPQVAALIHHRGSEGRVLLPAANARTMVSYVAVAEPPPPWSNIESSLLDRKHLFTGCMVDDEANLGKASMLAHALPK